MKKEIQFRTTSGNFTVDLFNPVRVITCGINYLNDLQIKVFTDPNEKSGYLLFYNLTTGKKTFSRLRVSYSDEFTRRKFGKGLRMETLPIIKTV
jgi:hypothetical protein